MIVRPIQEISEFIAKHREYFCFKYFLLQAFDNLQATSLKSFRIEGRKEMIYLTMHSTYFYLRLYGVGHIVKDHSNSERGNPLLPHGLLFPINSKGSFIFTIPQTG